MDEVIALINNVLVYLRELNLAAIITRCVLAVLLGGVVGADREKKHRPAGLRTYILVCLGSAIVMMIGQYASAMYGADATRLGAQVISGIGFLGAGTIIITGQYQVRGLTTAAGLWASACIGLALGVGFYEVAVVGFICILMVITLLNRFGHSLRVSSRYIRLYVELETATAISDFIHFLRENDIANDEMEFGNSRAADSQKKPFVIVNLRFKKAVSHEAVIEMLSEVEGISLIEEL